MIKQVMLYGSTIWSNCSADNLTRLLKLQKRAARVILGADTRSNSVNQQGSFLHEHARPLNKRRAWRLTTEFAFIKMARLKAIIAIILLVFLANVFVI